MNRSEIFHLINEERLLQDSQWGGPPHDDKHVPNDWCAILTRHLGLAFSDEAKIDPIRYKRQLVRVAAIAVAALESFNRLQPPQKVVDLTERGSGW